MGIVSNLTRAHICQLTILGASTLGGLYYTHSGWVLAVAFPLLLLQSRLHSRDVMKVVEDHPFYANLEGPDLKAVLLADMKVLQGRVQLPQEVKDQLRILDTTGQLRDANNETVNLGQLPSPPGSGIAE